MFIEILNVLLKSHQHSPIGWQCEWRPTFPIVYVSLPFFYPHSLISGLLLCLPIFFFLIPSPSHIHLPSLPILWFSAWLPSRLQQDGLSPEPPHIQPQSILLKMPTNVTFYLFLLLVYLSYAYITASPQEHWKVVSEKWELSTVTTFLAIQAAKMCNIVCAQMFTAHTEENFTHWEWLLTEQVLTLLGSVHQVQWSASSKSSLEGEEGNLCLSKSWPTTRGQNVVWTQSNVLHLNQKPLLNSGTLPHRTETKTGKIEIIFSTNILFYLLAYHKLFFRLWRIKINVRTIYNCIYFAQNNQFSSGPHKVYSRAKFLLETQDACYVICLELYTHLEGKINTTNNTMSEANLVIVNKPKS